ncbi:MAG: hypothetical protein ACR2NF_11290, partial [Pirellulales bacterium]
MCCATYDKEASHGQIPAAPYQLPPELACGHRPKIAPKQSYEEYHQAYLFVHALSQHQVQEFERAYSYVHCSHSRHRSRGQGS